LTAALLLGPAPAGAAPSVLQTIQSIVKRAIADAPNNFAGILGNVLEPGDSVNAVFGVSPAIRNLCETCDMNITDWHRQFNARTGITEQEYWEFALSVHLGTPARNDIPAVIRSILSPVIPALYKYTGIDQVRANEIEVGWRGPDGLLLHVKSTQTSTPPTYWYAIIYVQHTGRKRTR